MTDHAAAPAAETDRDGRPVADADPRDVDVPPIPRLRMVGSADAPACDGDGCAVPFAARMPGNANTNATANTDMEVSPE